MSVYRVINEAGHKEAEFNNYASAKMEAERLCDMGERLGHYRVEQVDIVYHTTWEQKK